MQATFLLMSRRTLIPLDHIAGAISLTNLSSCNICVILDGNHWTDFHSVHEELATRKLKIHECRLAEVQAKGKSM